MSDPFFSTPVNNAFGLANVYLHAKPCLVDIDNDGDIDAFIGKTDGNTVFFRNKGNAHNAVFDPPVTNPFSLTDVGYSSSPSLIDIDGDGDLDAFIGDRYNNSGVAFYNNIGNATVASFASPIARAFGLTFAGSNSTPTFVDIDNDSDMDAFIGDRNGNVQFLRNTGNVHAPAFASRSSNPFGLTDVGDKADPTFADIDSDGDLDAFVGNVLGETWFYRNMGNANNPIFDAPSVATIFNLTDVGNYASPSFVDIDNDGDLDAFVGNSNGDTLFFLNSANHTPSATNLNQTITYIEDTTAAITDMVITDADTGNTFTATITLATGNSAIGSLTATSGNSETYNATLGKWTVTGTKTAVNSALAAVSFVPVANSFNNTNASVSISDGIATITGTLSFNGISVNDAPVVSAPLINQTTTKNIVFNYTIPTGSFTDVDDTTLSYTATLADGAALPAWLSFNPTTKTFSGTPNATGSLNVKVTATDSAAASVSSSFNLSITTEATRYDNPVTDFNGDGKSDLVWHHSDGSIYAMTLNGASFADGGIVYGGLSADWQTLNSRGDYNGDGKTDVLFWNTATRSAWLAQMNGSAISNESYVSYAQNLPTGWAVADSTADYNNDGKSDLLWWNSTTSTAYLALHDGVTLTADATLFSGISGWAIQSAGGDYNGDGNSDILFWNASSSSLYMTTMNGTTISSQALIAGGLTGWTVADAKGDYNADGNSDILWRNAASGQLWEYQMNGTTISSSASVGTVSTAWQIISAHNDFNADGKADILWKNSDGSAGISLADTPTAITNLGAYTDWTVQHADNDVNADGKADVLWTKTDGAVYLMEMDGVSIIGAGQLGAYSGWSVLNV